MRRLAVWLGIRDDIVYVAVWRDEPLVKDRDRVSSRPVHATVTWTTCGLYVHDMRAT